MTDKRFHRITLTTALHFCFILPKKSMKLFYTYSWLTSIVILTYRRCSAVQPFKKGNVYHFHSIILWTISLTQESATKASAKVEKLQNLISQHRQLGVRPHHVCDDSKMLVEYRIKEIEKFHSAMNEDFQNQFKMHMIKIRISSTERHTNSWKLVLILVWLLCNVPVNGFSVMLGLNHCFLGINQYF